MAVRGRSHHEQASRNLRFITFHLAVGAIGTLEGGIAEGTAALWFVDSTTSRYHDHMTKQTTVRLPETLANDIEAVARIKGTSVNALIVDALKSELDRVRQDEDFTSRAKRLLERDRELLERLAR